MTGICSDARRAILDAIQVGFDDPNGFIKRAGTVYVFTNPSVEDLAVDNLRSHGQLPFPDTPPTGGFQTGNNVIDDVCRV